jgi:uncharacterized protein YjiS (DUF1127 family)
VGFSPYVQAKNVSGLSPLRGTGNAADLCEPARDKNERITMQGPIQSLVAQRAHPELRELVVEASRALARLDAERLEDLALSCLALNRDLEIAGIVSRRDLSRQAKDALQDLGVFGRVLEATRANLAVMNRIRAIRAGRFLAYSESEARSGTTHGNH